MTRTGRWVSCITYHVSRVACHVSRITLSRLTPLRCAPGAVAFRVLLVTLIAATCAPLASAQADIAITDRGVTMEFPDRITFEAHVESSAEIDQVVLEYGVEKLTCGDVTAKAFPDVEPGQSIDVEWTWEMIQSGSQPPGATIWYRWRATDKAGHESVSDEQRLTWLDDTHNWQSVSRDMLTLHWYDGSRSFAEDLLNSAVDSLAQLGETTGVKPQSPIDLYIYANTTDMTDATLYEPGWTGGQAFPDQDILIIGIGPDQIEWGKETEAHELTHVLVGHLTFTCLGDIPTWLNEGIAVYGEGGLDAPSEAALKAAIGEDTLISVRALSGGFSEHPDKANLSYSQSYSLVNFLVTEYGQDQLLQLFGNLRDGLPIEDALNDVYGFGLDGLEDRWRESIGAPPRQADSTAPTPMPIPTPVPTYVPLGGAPLAPPVQATTVTEATVAPTPAIEATSTATAEPKIAPTETAAPPTAAATPPTSLLTIMVFVVLFGGLAMIPVLLIQRKKNS